MADIIPFLDVLLSPVGMLILLAVFCAGGFAGAALVGGGYR